MPCLTNAKHEKFAQEIAKGTSANRAYVVAGYSEHTGNASKLARDKSIQARLAEIRSEAEDMERTALAMACEALSIDKQWVMGRLVENANRAMQAVEIRNQDGGTGEYKYDGAVANRSLELLGKELGMFKDKTEIKHSGGMDIAWLPVS